MFQLHDATCPVPEHPRTLMSSAHSRLSNGSDSLNFSMSGSVLPVKRPPHSFAAGAAGAAGGALGALVACGHIWRHGAARSRELRVCVGPQAPRHRPQQRLRLLQTAAARRTCAMTEGLSTRPTACSERGVGRRSSWARTRGVVCRHRPTMRPTRARTGVLEQRPAFAAGALRVDVRSHCCSANDDAIPP